MATSESIRCRVAACHVGRGAWEFFLINDSDAPLDRAVLKRVMYEWGDIGNSKVVDVQVPGLAPGAHALIWRDDDDCAEMRVELSVQVCRGIREGRLTFEFPLLYKMKRQLSLVAGLDKAGWQVSAEF